MTERRGEDRQQGGDTGRRHQPPSAADPDLPLGLDDRHEVAHVGPLPVAPDAGQLERLARFLGRLKELALLRRELLEPPEVVGQTFPGQLLPVSGQLLLGRHRFRLALDHREKGPREPLPFLLGQGSGGAELPEEP